MTVPERTRISGSCLCGAVRFSGDIEETEVTACHCGQCRRWSGHVWASFHLHDSVVEGDALCWYRSSDDAERGFCATCGSSLFWRTIGRQVLSVSPGSLDDPTGLHLARHIFVADKGDYYQIEGDPPRGHRS